MPALSACTAEIDLPQTVIADAYKPNDVLLADVDGDGWLDAVLVADRPGSHKAQIVWLPYSPVLDGFRNPVVALTLDSGNLAVFKLVDFDDDGYNDVLLATMGADKLSIYRNLGEGVFATAPLYAWEGVMFNEVSLDVGDFNGDSRTDLLLASQEGDNRLLLAFQSPLHTFPYSLNNYVSLGASIEYMMLAVAFDFDADGDDDIVAVYKNLPDPTPSPVPEYCLVFVDFMGWPALAPEPCEAQNAPGITSAGNMVAGQLTPSETGVVYTSRNGDLRWARFSGGRMFVDSQTFTSKSTARPALYDVNGDGFIDLVIGDGSAVQYLRFDAIQFLGDTDPALFDTGSPSITGVAVGVIGAGPLPSVVAAYTDSNAGAAQLIDRVPGMSWVVADVLAAPSRASFVPLVGDIDGDGVADIVIADAAPDSHGLFWYKGVAGEASFGSRRGISSTSLGSVKDAALIDVDDSGDLDVAFLISGDVEVYVNQGEVQPTFLLGAALATGLTNAERLYAADVDDDSLTDLVVVISASHTIALLRNTGGGVFAETSITIPGMFVDKVILADMNGDSLLDAVVPMPQNTSLGWIPYVASLNGWSTDAMVVVASSFFVHVLDAGDMDNDGDIDLVAVHPSTGTLTWFLALDGSSGTAFDRASLELSTVGGNARAISLSDVNGDGMPDVIISFGSPTGSLVSLLGYLSTSGIGFSIPQPLATGLDITRPAFADVDGDGRTDTVAVNTDAVSATTATLVLRTDGERKLRSFYPITLSDSDGAGVIDMAFGDVDGDGLIDAVVVSASESRAMVYRNTANGMFGTGSELPSMVTSPAAVAVADMDGDGDLDVVVAATPSVVWFENVDAAGTFSRSAGGYNIGEGFTVRWMDVADMDGDGDADIVLSYLSTVEWTANVAGTGAMWSSGNAVATVEADTGAVADIDNDGDYDVVVCVAATQSVAWHANTGAGFGTAQAVSTGAFNVTSVVVGDVNNDGTIDVVGVNKLENSIAWFRNVPSGGSAWVGQTVSDTYAGAASPVLGDVDGDGDLDLVVASSVATQSTLFVFDAGLGSFARDQDVYLSHMTSEAAMADWDADGDADMLVVDTMNNLVGLLAATRTGAFAYQPKVRSFSKQLLGCTKGLANGFACVRANVGGASRCVRDTIELPAATYSCGVGAHGQIKHAVTIVGPSGASPTAIFDCNGDGVLFRAMKETSVLSRTWPGAGNVVLKSVAVVGGSTGRASLYGAPTLRAEGSGSVIALEGSTMAQCESKARDVTGDLIDVGFGGAMLAKGGGSVQLLAGSSISGSSAAFSGGALYAAGAGSSVIVRDSVVSGCSASEGGAILVTSSASATVENGQISGCIAGLGGGIRVARAASVSVTSSSSVSANTALGSGWGGGLAIDGDAKAEVVGATLESNVAGFGGGIGVVQSSLASAVASSTRSVDLPIVSSTLAGNGLAAVGANTTLVTLSGVTLRNNVADRVGGGIFACGGAVDVIGSATTWDGNVRDGLRQDGFVCRWSSTSVAVSRTPASMLPWIRMDAAAEAATSSGSVGGPLTALRAVDVAAAAATQVVEPGSGLELEFHGEDWLGQSMIEPGVEPVLSFAAVPGLYTAGTSTTSLSSAKTAMPRLTLQVGVAGQDTLPLSTTWSLSAGESVTGLSGSVRIDGCGPGSGAVATTNDGSGESVLVCSVCALGTSAGATSMAPCEAVAGCPANTLRVTSINGTSACECEVGFFAPSGLTDVACEECRAGASCAGGVAQPVPQVGFYDAGNLTFVRCRRTAGCPGGAGGCAIGYEGYMCNSCTKGFYSDTDGECRTCPPTASSTFVQFAIGLAVASSGVGVCLALMQSRSARRAAATNSSAANLSSEAAQLTRIREFRRISTPATVSMVLVAFQVVGILAGSKFAWSSRASQVLGGFSAFNIDISLFASECALDSFHTKYLVSMAAPVAIIVVGVIVALVCRLVGRGPFSPLVVLPLRTVCESALFSITPLLYIPLSKATLVLFDCTKLPNGAFVLDVDPGVSCFDASWWGVFPVSLASCALFVLGLPVYFAISLYQARASLATSDAMMARLGPLYRLYRSVFYLGEVGNLGKRLGLVVTATFFSDSQMVQIGLMLAIFLAWTGMVLRVRPYYHPLYNTVDVYLNTILIAILILGTGAYAERATTADNTVGDWMAIIAVVALALVSVWAVAKDVWLIVQARADTYSMAKERRHQLADSLLAEVQDIEATGRLQREVERIVAALEGDSEAAREAHVVAMEDVAPMTVLGEMPSPVQSSSSSSTEAGGGARSASAAHLAISISGASQYTSVDEAEAMSRSRSRSCSRSQGNMGRSVSEAMTEDGKQATRRRGGRRRNAPQLAGRGRVRGRGRADA
ncbi:uncharacterized protein AMSG_09702 [Thecamonas trahens ATCC 50062]|uniref:Fibronectin type III domain-containing protein n=1 Tax=Thecamonas trahens ATCC 50062 TaxID=461836 RepID=A0A0L0DP39_THETB|nr:hypothetical protein AMSG_09702 [Thecamonas trahens ATCC 50062]KNC54040.1 hypothetical protein AMSG_09702 [Thecamonas trahens ATCC 50062]|eukprot:XP_013754051.1 hypothetical protein AMSG_09702 [Thecamonas trahens ATCC 50062]